MAFRLIVSALYGAATVAAVSPWGLSPLRVGVAIACGTGLFFAWGWGEKKGKTVVGAAALAFGCSPFLWWGIAADQVAPVICSVIAFAAATRAFNGGGGRWLGAAAAAAATAANGAFLFLQEGNHWALAAAPVNLTGSLLYIGLASPWLWVAPLWADGTGSAIGTRGFFVWLAILGAAVAFPLAFQPGPNNYLGYTLRWGPALGVAAAWAGKGRAERPGAAWAAALGVAALGSAEFLFAAVAAGKLVFEAAMRQGAPRFLGVW